MVNKKKTIIFDLDETLVKAEYVTDEALKKRYEEKGWHSINIQFTKEQSIPIMISIRPGTIDMLCSLK